jgi:hypothetical protein
MTCTHWPKWLLVALLATSASRGDDSAQPVADEQIEAERAAQASRASRAYADRYWIQAADATAAELQPEPLLRWSNPAVGSIHGDVFLWTSSGRPVAVASLYQWFSPFTHRTHEFTALTESTLSASFDGQPAWQTSEPALRFQPVPEAAEPSPSPALRLSQMRALAREFSATRLDREQQSQELRLMSQPVHRYGPTDDAQLLDGAIFVLAQGTDPEVLLLLEARPHAGNHRWEFAAAPMNSIDFTLRHHDQVVWHVEIRPWSEVRSHAATYTTFTGKDLPPEGR